MPRAEFYLIDKPRFRGEPLLLVCKLAERAFEQQLPTLVLARSAEQAEALDDLLWSFDPDAFVPHQIAGNDEDDITAVLIVPPGTSTPDRTLVINLRDQCAEGSFDVVKEIVPADPAERAGARQRWRDYQQRGLDVGKFDI
jgi:DNA polymerase III subunit chi